MTALTIPVRCSIEAINAKFLDMLPNIIRMAQIAFGGNKPDKREEAVQNTLAWAFILLRQMAMKGRLDEANSSPIAYYAIRRHLEGRHIDGTSSKDVTSEYCRNRARSAIKHFEFCERISDNSRLDRTMKFYMDFEVWFLQQPERDQGIILDLGKGCTTREIGEKYGFAQSRVYQLQAKYAKSWSKFIAEKAEQLA